MVLLNFSFIKMLNTHSVEQLNLFHSTLCFKYLLRMPWSSVIYSGYLCSVEKFVWFLFALAGVGGGGAGSNPILMDMWIT